MNIFSNRVLLLTGANGGIGRAIAEQFYAAGANLILGDIAESELRSFAESLDPSGNRVATMQIDVSVSEDAERIVAFAEGTYGGIDFLVPSAGIYPGHLVESMSDDEWRRVMAINLNAVFYLVRRAIRILKDGGSIVTIASVGGHTGVRGHGHYAASKGQSLHSRVVLPWNLHPDCESMQYRLESLGLR